MEMVRFVNGILYKNFSDLTGKEVYDICRLRSSVFVLEQKIVCEEELDGKDEVCRHLLVKAGDELWPIAAWFQNRIVGIMQRQLVVLSFERKTAIKDLPCK